MLDNILTRQLCAANGWRIAEATIDPNQRIAVRLEPTRTSAVCSGCGETKRRFHDFKKARVWRHLDAWGVQTLVIAPLRRVRCRWCGIRVERVPWARVRSHFTHQFEAEVLRRAKDTSVLGVCRQLQLHWSSVMAMIERWVEESARRRFRRPLRRIGVDEVAYGRGHSKYLTIVWDHDRSCVVWIGHGRERETFGEFFRKLGARRCSRLAVVTMDMSRGYIAAAREYAPQADIVFDRFHIERYLTWAVDALRAREFARCIGPAKDIVRGKRWLLLRKYRRLRRDQRRDLDAVLATNRTLFRGYILKEQFDRVWKCRRPSEMKDFIRRWRTLLGDDLRALANFANMLIDHIDGVCAWAKHRLTNAALEGNNSRIRGLSQRARGYRSSRNLMLVLYHATWR